MKWIGVICLVFMCAVEAHSASFYLNPSSGNDSNDGSIGSPWKTINKVTTSTSVNAGDIIYVRGGTYTRSQYTNDGTWVVLNQSSTYRKGTSGNPITFRNFPGETVVFDGQHIAAFMRFQGNVPTDFYWVIQGLRFNNYSNAISAGDSDGAVYGNYIAVVGCEFDNGSTRSVIDPGQGSVGTAWAHHIVQKGNYSHNIGHHQNYIAEQTDWYLMDGNSGAEIAYYGLHGYGHRAEGASPNNLRHWIVRRNTWSNIAQAGVIVTGSHDVSNIYIYNNTFWNEPGLSFATDASGAGGNGDQGITFKLTGTYTGPVVLKNNITYGSFANANFEFTNANGLWSSGFLDMDFNLVGNVVSNNRLYAWRGVTYNLTDFKTATGGVYEGHAVNGNPLFNNVGGGDFTLQSGSPAIDAGTNRLTSVVGSGSGVTFIVGDAGYFFDGWGLLVGQGDVIKVGGNSPVRIVSINYGTNSITVESSITWSNNDPVALAYNGNAPDIGAFESGETAPPSRTVGTFYISTGGTDSNCASIQSEGTPAATVGFMISCALGGSTFIFADGTYTDTNHRVRVSDVLVSGSPGAVTTFRAKNNKQAVIQSQPGQYMVYVLGGVSYVVVDGFVLDGVNVSGTIGMSFDSGGVGNKFVNGEIKRMGSEAGYVVGCTGCEVSESSIHNNGNGILLDSTVNMLVAHNSFDSNVVSVGYYVNASSGTRVTRNDIKGNSGVGIQLKESSGALVDNNVVYSNGGKGLETITGTTGLKGYNNTFWTNTLADIDVNSGSSGVLLTNNIVSVTGSITDNGSGTVQTTNFNGDPGYIAPGPPSTWHVGGLGVWGAGTVLGEVTVDYYGASRVSPYNTIGAVEEGAPPPGVVIHASRGLFFGGMNGRRGR